VAAVHTALGEGFVLACATGRALPLEQTIAEARQIGEPGTPGGAKARWAPHARRMALP
jgi:hypothetical protein